jgi:hypothetical protein
MQEQRKRLAKELEFNSKILALLLQVLLHPETDKMIEQEKPIFPVTWLIFLFFVIYHDYVKSFCSTTNYSLEVKVLRQLINERSLNSISFNFPFSSAFKLWLQSDNKFQSWILKTFK